MLLFCRQFENKKESKTSLFVALNYKSLIIRYLYNNIEDIKIYLYENIKDYIINLLPFTFIFIIKIQKFSSFK